MHKTLFLFLTVLLNSHIFAASNRDFDLWLDGLYQEALEKGISTKTLEKAFENLAPLDRVMQLDRRQPEKTQTLNRYMTNVVSQARIAKGRSELKFNDYLLKQIKEQYNIQPRFIIALWAIESDFGRNTGEIPIIGALATLAFSGKRSTYFRKELLVALDILDSGDINPEDMTGSWAGAMGQCQFMPWSYQRRAVDFDGDGKRDIWHSRGDVFASIANYLKSSGWQGDQTWGREVLLPPNFEHKLLGLKTTKSLDEWQALGVRRLNGSALPKRQLQASLVHPRRSNGRTFLIYDNYRVLLKWNNSHYFALAVGYLADRIDRQ
tara:strand:+ start:1742 stop:2707 length:966 start_codon:yes stop_codon:yes gene_type:complete